MKRCFRLFIIILMLTALFCLTGCSTPEFASVVSRYGLPTTGCDVVFHFCDEIRGGVDVSTTLTGKTADMFLASLAYCTPTSSPRDSYSVQLSADYQITVTSGQQNVMDLYYDAEHDWLVAEVSEDKLGTAVIHYFFYTPDPVTAALMESAADHRVTETDGQSLQTSSLVIRAGISTDMLVAGGTSVDYTLYTGSYAYVEDAALYHIYTSAELPDVVTGSEGLVLCSLGKCETTGYAINISQIDYTDHLIRVFLNTEAPAYPDDEEQVEAHPYVMATCDLDDFPLGLTVAFIDQNYTILDVQTIDIP